MVERKISKGIYLVAAIITAVIFISGILLGLIMTNTREDIIGEQNKLQKLDLESIQLQYLYLNVFSKEKNCPVAQKALQNNLNGIDKTRRQLESYLSDTLSENNEAFLNLKREYMIAELRYWLLSIQVRELCGNDNVPILYFYSNRECSDCVLQGNILTFLKDRYNDKILIFAIDADFDREPGIEIMKVSYNITKTPSLVIGNTKYEGLMTKEGLFEVFCSDFKDVFAEECENEFF